LFSRFSFFPFFLFHLFGKIFMRIATTDCTTTRRTTRRTTASMLASAVLIALITLIASAVPAHATPQMSLMTGNKCMNCHINAQGSGLRNELGWYVARDMKLVEPKDIGLGWLYALDRESNSFFDGVLTIGMDLRGQLTRSPVVATAERRIIPMQFALSAALQPLPWLTIEGMAEIGSLVRGNIYAGQQAWSASVIFQPSYELPTLRVGHFQPSIGMRYDDHTMLVRQVAGAYGSPLIAPNFAEYGAELNYDGLKWLTLTAGAYLPRSLAQLGTTGTSGNFEPLLTTVPQDSASFSQLTGSPTTLARAVVWLRTDDHLLNNYVGASAMNNGRFTLINAFAGLGLSDRLSLMGEYAIGGVLGGRQTRNLSLELMYQPFVGLMPFVRYEHGRTTIAGLPGADGEQFATQVVVGAQIFPIPYVELRPEFRYFDTEYYTSTRWNLQLHIFY
jgi:hypothetical protein